MILDALSLINLLIFKSVNCGNPADQIDNSIVNILGYRDPAVEGNNITFSCLSGRVLNGPNTATCVGNGEWEPDLREVECLGESYIIQELAIIWPY